jgi:hypothetical protein
MQGQLAKRGEDLLESIREELAKELTAVPPHGKIRFELTFRDYHLQRLLTTREVSRLYEGGEK